MESRILNTSERLRIGDIVTLRHAKPNEGWLSAQGVVNLDCYLARESAVHLLENCLWQVTVQNQYSATIEYEEYLLASSDDGVVVNAPSHHANAAANLTEASEHEIKIAQLKRTAQNEKRLNKKLMSMKVGKPVAFGDVIQLQHVKTKTFLTVSYSALARQERENMRVFIKDNGDALSWLEFMPRYKYDREGQQIVDNNECYIRVHERSSEYIHAARKAAKGNPDGNKEINCSLETSIWTINIYQQARETRSKNIVAGNLVSLQEPETSTYLTLDQQKPGLTERANVIMSNSMQLSFAVSDCNVGTNLLWMIERDDMFTGGPLLNRASRIALRDLNTGLYMCVDRKGTISAVKNREDCTMLQIASTQQLDAGVNIVDSVLVQLIYGSDSLSYQKGIMEMQSDRTAALSLVISSKLQMVMGVELYVGVEACFTLRSFEELIRTRKLFDMPAAAVEHEFKTVFGCLDHLTVFLKQEKESSVFDASHCNFFGFEQGLLKADLEAVGGTTVVTRQTMMREQGILDVLLDIIEFCTDAADYDPDTDSQLSHVPVMLKNLGGNQGAQQKGSFSGSFRNFTRTKSIDSGSGSPRQLQHAGASDGDVADMCLHVLYLCVHKNHINQIHIADRFASLLSQVKEQPNAVVCVQEILRDNLQILQTKVSEREIKIFLDLLEDSPMNVTLLKLLRSTCSCPTGVDNTQRMVATALYSQNLALRKSSSIDSRFYGTPEDKRISWSKSSPMAGFDIVGKARELSHGMDKFSALVIEIRPNYSNLRKVNWSDKKLYLPTDEEDIREVLAYSLVRDGMPLMMVKWKTGAVGEEDFSMKTLFGSAGEIPLEYLASMSNSQNADKVRNRLTISQKQQPQAESSVRRSMANSDGSSRRVLTTSTSRKTIRRNSLLKHQASARKLKLRKSVVGKAKTMFEKKVQVAEYFIAQMYLAADLCLDRNYVAIGMLEVSFPIELLFSLLRSSSIPHRFKAPVCRLIRTLYLDREPQVVAKFPRLVKTSVSLSGGEEDSFSDHHSGSPFTFAVLQQIISDYLHNELDATKCDELSAEMLDLLLALVQFGFYHTSEQLQDIIVPLVQALENHRTREKEGERIMDARRRSSLSSLSFWTPPSSSVSERKISFSIPRAISLVSRGSKDDDDNDQGSESAPSRGGQALPRQRSGSMSMNRQTSKNLSESIKSLKIAEKKSDVEVGKSSKKKSDLDIGKSLKNDKNAPTQWAEWCLGQLESVRALMMVLCLVIATTVYSTLQIVLSLEVDERMATLDFVVSMIFVFELSIRMYFYAAVHSELRSFVKQPLNALDIMVVILDIILLSLDAQILGDAATFAKSLKTVRTLRLIRVFRAARLLKKIVDRTNMTETWVIPERYSNTTENEVRTIAGMLRVLSHVQGRIQDRKLTGCIKAFVEWYEAESAGKAVDAKMLFQKYLQQEQGLSDTIPKKFDQTLIDIAMYMDASLVKEALQILLLYKSQDELLFQSMRSLQLIYTPKMEIKYKSICQWLKQLQRLAEAFEMWSDMGNKDELSVAASACGAIESIIDMVRVRTVLKDFDLNPVSFVDPEVQQLLNNMDAMSVFMTLQNALLDASLGEPHPQVKKIVSACNDLIALFVENNETTQAIAFKHIDWFLDRVDDGIHSSKVARYVLSGNRYLIKQCQRRYLAEFMQKIVSHGRKPEYLDMFVGMTQINDTGDSGVSALHSEIARYVTNVDRSDHVLLWCCGPKSKGYQERHRVMADIVKLSKPVPDALLPSDLQYHVNLLLLLAGCKLGPKLQAVYPLDDVIAGILDEGTISNVRNGLVLLVVEMVTAHVDGMEASESMWNFFEYVTQSFELSCTDLPFLLQRSDNHLKLLHRKEWMASCLKIISIFFSDFDFEEFRDYTSFESDEHFSVITKRSESEVRDVINSMFRSIKNFRDRHLGTLSKVSKAMIEEALVTWSDFSDESHMDVAVTMKDRRKSHSANRRASLVAEIQQVFYRKQFSAFVDAIAPPSTDTSTLTHAMDPLSLELLERLPSVYDPLQSDVRLEPFFLKITTHMRGQLVRTTSARILDKSSMDTSVWVMRTLRHIIEKNIGTTVEKISAPRAVAEILDISYFHSVMDDYGVTYLCLELISVGIDTKLCVEAVKLLVALLTKHGGNASVQRTIHHYLNSTDSTLFFEEVKDLIEQLQVWCQRETELAYDSETPQSEYLPPEVYVLQLIYAMCDGNFLPNKNIMRDQEGNSRFVNILDYLTGFIDLLSRLESALCTQIAIRVMHTILGLMRGPCHGSQEHFVLHTELLTALNRLMRASRPSVNLTAAWAADIDVLKEYVIDVMRASIEGLPEGSVVVERVQTAIEVNVLNVLIVPTEVDEFGISLDLSCLSRLQAKYLVFLKTLNDKNAEMPPNAVDCIEEDIAYVEVVWNQKLYQHYFHIPDVAKDLSESSKRKLVEEVDFLTQEIKLNDFMKKSRELHREGVHQQMLKSFGLVHLWAWKGVLAKFLLVNVVVMNVLMTIHFTVQTNEHTDLQHRLFGYQPDDHYRHRGLAISPLDHASVSSSPHDIYIPEDIYRIIHGLNGVHIAAVMVTLSIILIVRVPLVFAAYMDGGQPWFVAVCLAIFTPNVTWYMTHTIVAWIAFSVNPLFLSALLLEFISVDSATKEIMLAVVNPMRQLLTTMAIILIVIHVFASVVFVFFRDDFLHLMCNSLWKSLKLMISYGFRSEEGIGRYMHDTIGIRIIVDVSFYFIIVVILRNIFFGIIIDTFGELRGIKMDRELDLNGRCFICGVDQQEFDKRIRYGSGIDFKQHRTDTHNMWNYLYFAMRIWQQPRSQDTSLEMYVRQCIESNDVSWFPIGLIGMNEKDEGGEKKEYEESERREGELPGGRPRSAPRIRASTQVDGAGLGMLDSRLNMIQERLSHLQNSSQTETKKWTSTHGLDEETSKIIEKVVQDEIEPLQAALEEVIEDMNALCSRLQKFDVSCRRRRIVSQSSQEIGGVSGPSLDIVDT